MYNYIINFYNNNCLQNHVYRFDMKNQFFISSENFFVWRMINHLCTD